MEQTLRVFFCKGMVPFAITSCFLHAYDIYTYVPEETEIDKELEEEYKEYKELKRQKKMYKREIERILQRKL